MQTPETAYATFAGLIDQAALNRIFNSFGAATQGGTKAIHLLFQSTGGMIADGVSLYNYFLAVPIELHVYNTGSVQSVAVPAYLGAKYRHASAHATFMIHKSTFPSQAASAVKMKALADTLGLEDERIEIILKSQTKIPADKWELHQTHDVHFTAKEAITFGIAQDIREFQIPPNNQVFNI